MKVQIVEQEKILESKLFTKERILEPKLLSKERIVEPKLPTKGVRMRQRLRCKYLLGYCVGCPSESNHTDFNQEMGQIKLKWSAKQKKEARTNYLF